MFEPVIRREIIRPFLCTLGKRRIPCQRWHTHGGPFPIVTGKHAIFEI